MKSVAILLNSQFVNGIVDLMKSVIFLREFGVTVSPKINNIKIITVFFGLSPFVCKEKLYHVAAKTCEKFVSA